MFEHLKHRSRKQSKTVTGGREYCKYIVEISCFSHNMCAALVSNGNTKVTLVDSACLSRKLS